MSFDLAVWEGNRPSSDVKALAAYLSLYDQWFGEDADPNVNHALSPAIASYVNELLQHWPDITTDAGDASPWADGPLMNNAAGNFFYFAMV